MPWNPETYNLYKQERYAPFYDALQLIDPRPGMRAVDLGCGTGELTRMLADHLPDAVVHGVDSSAQMLAESGAFQDNRVSFAQRDISEILRAGERYDLVFSNAALQWLPDHRALFPALVSLLKPGGQLVVQMPAQHRNAANRELYRLAAETPFAEALTAYHNEVSMLDPEDYAALLFGAGGNNIRVSERIYPLIVPDAEGVYEFINGSALRPYLAALSGTMRETFSETFRQRLHEAFPDAPVFYPFKRILIAAQV